MANIKARLIEIADLTKADKDALRQIYNLRCLNSSLLFRYIYSNEDLSDEYFKKHLKTLIECGFIEAVEHGSSEPAYFLTTKGVSAVRQIDHLPTVAWDADSGDMKDGYKKSSDLRMLPANINHQLALNTFILKFKERADGEIGYCYKDEKFTGMYSNIRPDGIIETNSVEIFVEMDMSTESKKALESKWDHYRRYLNSDEYMYKDKKLIILFVTEACSNIRTRRSVVLTGLSRTIFDRIDSQMDMFIGSTNDLLDIVFDRILPETEFHQQRLEEMCAFIEGEHGFRFSPAQFLSKYLPAVSFEAYCRKLNSDNKIVVEKGRTQEFLFDTYWYDPISVLKKIAFFYNTESTIQQKLKRQIPYLVLVDNEKDMYYDLKTINAREVPCVYFTTEARLNVYPFHEALYQYNTLGHISHFTEPSLQVRKFETIIQ